MKICEWCLEVEGIGTVINHDSTWNCWMCQECFERIEDERETQEIITYEDTKFFGKPHKMIGKNIYYYDDVKKIFVLFVPLVVTNEKVYRMKQVKQGNG